MKSWRLILLLLVLGCGQKAKEMDNVKPIERAREELDSLIAANDLPGIQYLVLDRSGVRFEYNGGVADVAAGTRVTENTTFMASSSTKTITALAVLKLVETGVVDLDDSLDRHLPENPYGNAVTIRQLISHTAGIPNPLPVKWLHPVKDHGRYDEQKELGRVLADNPKLSSEPGKKYAYSNLGYWLLGAVIERRTKGPYCDYVHREILAPLDIVPAGLDCFVHDPTKHARGHIKRLSLTNFAMMFLSDSAFFGETAHGWRSFNPLYMNGPAYGGLIGTARGWGKFLADQLADRSLLMSEETRRLFYEQQGTADQKQVETTLGWHVGDLAGNRFFGKPGGGPGFSSNIRVYPENGIATVWLSNRMEVSEKPIHVLSNALDRHFLQ
jgi:D-alanyl-D-alanine carboxypeptidase